jgi:hypothetical protein
MALHCSGIYLSLSSIGPAIQPDLLLIGHWARPGTLSSILLSGGPCAPKGVDHWHAPHLHLGRRRILPFEAEIDVIRHGRVDKDAGFDFGRIRTIASRRSKAPIESPADVDGSNEEEIR